MDMNAFKRFTTHIENDNFLLLLEIGIGQNAFGDQIRFPYPRKLLAALIR